MKPSGDAGVFFVRLLSMVNRSMSLRVGTVGFSHHEWKGAFYPEKISQKNMLAYYAERFSTVEINFTFRQLPTQKTVETWVRQVPDSFRFVLKGWQAITHFKRLKNAEVETDQFLDAASVLGEKQGPILFQLPPTFEKDIPKLDAFLKQIAGRAKVAIEFRHASWFDDELFDCLRAHSAVLCVADGDHLPQLNLVRTADWGYVRLPDDTYSDVRLRDWLMQIRSQWDETYVFFMHEDKCIGPKLAVRFLELVLA
jgi:uncharacterized protein YecE (DUF72 family)